MSHYAELRDRLGTQPDHPRFVGAPITVDGLSPDELGALWPLLQRVHWNPDAGGAATNTVDEWLNGMPGLKVVSSLPFLASHRDDVHSTIFGFRNTRYSSIIDATEREMMAMVGMS